MAARRRAAIFLYKRKAPRRSAGLQRRIAYFLASAALGLGKEVCLPFCFPLQPPLPELKGQQPPFSCPALLVEQLVDFWQSLDVALLALSACTTAIVRAVRHATETMIFFIILLII